MFLSTNSLSIENTFPCEYNSIPLISWFVFLLILQAFTNQNATEVFHNVVFLWVLFLES